jgi:hypothetical protein
MNNELEILEVMPDPDKMTMALNTPLHPHLPDISTGALGLMIAPVKSGKSTIITNLLANEAFYKDRFDAVHIFSNTIMNDSTSRFLKELFPGTIHGEYSDKAIKSIIAQQESYKDKKDRPFIAVILDDFVGIPRSSYIYQLASRYRHYGIGLLLFSSQVFKEVHPLVRTNMTFAILGKNSNRKEKEKICDELGNSFGDNDKNFHNLCKSVWKTPYHFAYIDYTENPPDMYDTFTTKIWEGGRPLVKMKGVEAMVSDSDEEEEKIEDYIE